MYSCGPELSNPGKTVLHPQPGPYLPLPKLSPLGPSLTKKTCLILSQSTSFLLTLDLAP